MERKAFLSVSQTVSGLRLRCYFNEEIPPSIHAVISESTSSERPAYSCVPTTMLWNNGLLSQNTSSQSNCNTQSKRGAIFHWKTAQKEAELWGVMNAIQISRSLAVKKKRWLFLSCFQQKSLECLLDLECLLFHQSGLFTLISVSGKKKNLPTRHSSLSTVLTMHTLLH